MLGNKVKFDTENQPQLQGRYMCVIKSKAVRRVTCFSSKNPEPWPFTLGGMARIGLRLIPCGFKSHTGSSDIFSQQFLYYFFTTGYQRQQPKTEAKLTVHTIVLCFSLFLGALFLC